MTTENSIDYKKIILNTLLRIPILFAIVFLLNCWPQIKQSLSGTIPPLNDWLDQGIQLNSLYVIVLITAYFYFRAVSKAKQEIAKGN